MNENGWKFAFCKISSKFIKDNNEIRISQRWTKFVNKMCQIRCERKYPMSLRNFLTIFHLNHSSSIPFEISAAWPLVCCIGVPDTLLPISYAVLRSNELWFTFWSWNRTTFLSDPLGWKKGLPNGKTKGNIESCIDPSTWFVFSSIHWWDIWKSSLFPGNSFASHAAVMGDSSVIFVG